MSPADVGLGVFQLLLLGLALAQLSLVEARFEHCHCFGAVTVLRTVVLALDNDAGGQVSDPHRRIGFVDVLAACAGRAVSVDAQIGRIDLDFKRVVDFRVNEHRSKARMPAGVRVKR